MAARADIKPHELVRLVQTRSARGRCSPAGCIWECTSCQTCITRCPQKVDISAHERRAAALSLREGRATGKTAVPVFNDVFLRRRPQARPGVRDSA